MVGDYRGRPPTRKELKVPGEAGLQKFRILARNGSKRSILDKDLFISLLEAINDPEQTGSGRHFTL